MTLKEKILVTGKIKLLTGLHIGGTNAALNIGGPDKFVVRNPITNKPYIPGSSLKGKLRSLIELRDGTLSKNGPCANGPTNNKSTAAGALFGAMKKDDNHPSRLIVRDAPLISDDQIFSNTDMPYTESKTEVSIDRIRAISTPRTIERVPAGAEFAMNMVVNIFEGENKEQLLKTLKEAIELLEDDYLGGNGSRGYGQIKITDYKETPKAYKE